MGKNFSELENNSAKRLIGIGAVILLHLIILYGLITGLSKHVEKPTDEPVELLIIQDKKPEPEKPKPIEKPPELPKLVEKVLKTPDPKPREKQVQKTNPDPKPQEKPTEKPTQKTSESPESTPTQKTESEQKSDPTPKSKPAGETRGVSRGEAGCKKPDYPRESLQSEEQGEILISVFVGADGKVKEAKVKKSSGSKALDRAASKAFSLCTFKPALKNGEPQDSWYDIPYEFVMN
ncbi:TonB family protein [Acinetobacter bereziniae]|uniref:TonB family protein n=1 Tax=Acinetobacter TaxID=469 RepID=UPI000EF70E70|nr:MULTISPECIES: TonB family protein [Acinetobacter]MEC8123528.1 TonB family protein [Pseudomonadota bacterium]MBJ8420880.1 TonB family protein [Acinetobacter bereziniae]MBJ9948495.1 TonB family protein [Acinetobacter bereziniae]MCU4474573.1 TonB family protein [Acinetobacter bereziniae]MCU4541804.1 TonB family protein [Acinetobacter bereziniae]